MSSFWLYVLIFFVFWVIVIRLMKGRIAATVSSDVQNTKSRRLSIIFFLLLFIGAALLNFHTPGSKRLLLEGIYFTTIGVVFLILNRNFKFRKYGLIIHILVIILGIYFLIAYFLHRNLA